MHIKNFLIACGWHSQSGEFFYPQAHPHIHMRLDGVGIESIDIGNNRTYQNKTAAYKALKPKIRMVAISDGPAGGGINLVSDGSPTKNIKNALNIVIEKGGGETVAAERMKAELHYILQAFGYGYQQAAMPSTS